MRRRTAHDRDIVMAEHVAYDNATRLHRTLAPETPEGPRAVQRKGVVTAIPRCSEVSVIDTSD